MLFEELYLNGITKKEACCLFNRSPKTLERWNNNPPMWVIRIIRLIGKKPPFPDDWYGWYFDRHFIVDPAGNSFHINEVSTIFWTRQLTESLTGSTSNIRSLKTELEKKINALDADITITVNIGSNIEKIINVKPSVINYDYNEDEKEKAIQK